MSSTVIQQHSSWIYIPIEKDTITNGSHTQQTSNII